MTNQSVKKVLIVGGGISGLAAAVALHKIGVEAEIVEKEIEWNVYGVGIIQPPNALRALNEIGLAAACMEQGFSYPGFDYYTGQGHFMFPGDSPTIEGYPGVNGISRRELHEILLAAVESVGTKIYMGSTVNKLENIPNGVNVELSNGITAAHGTAPHLGQGASIAIEDVIVLADILKHGLSIKESFEIFMEKRFERCKLIVENSDQLVEWELLAWNGQMDSNVNIGQYVHETLAKMNEPFLTELNTL